MTTYRTHTVKVTLTDRPGIINEIKETLLLYKIKVTSLNARMSNKKTLKLELIVRKPNDLGMDKLINILNSIAEAQDMEIE